VVSSSANTADVLRVTGLEDLLEERIDSVVAQRQQLRGKPAPDTFLECARRLGAPPPRAAVFEDALAGVQAGRAGRFGCVIGVDRVGHGGAARTERTPAPRSPAGACWPAPSQAPGAAAAALRNPGRLGRVPVAQGSGADHRIRFECRGSRDGAHSPAVVDSSRERSSDRGKGDVPTVSMTTENTPPEGTPDAPILGAIHRFGVIVSKVEHWRDEGVYFIRSCEFDLYAEDEDFQTAVVRFGESFEDLAHYLGELVEREDATEAETETFVLVAARYLDIEQREDADRRRHSLLNLRLRRRRRSGHWALRTTPNSSSQPSPA
jgi:hypothetical protein